MSRHLKGDLLASNYGQTYETKLWNVVDQRMIYPNGAPIFHQPQNKRMPFRKGNDHQWPDLSFTQIVLTHLPWHAGTRHCRRIWRSSSRRHDQTSDLTEQKGCGERSPRKISNRLKPWSHSHLLHLDCVLNSTSDKSSFGSSAYANCIKLSRRNVDVDVVTKQCSLDTRFASM